MRHTFLPAGLLLAFAGCALTEDLTTEDAPSTAAAVDDARSLEKQAFADNILMRYEDAESLYRESALRTGDATAGGDAQIEQELYLALNKSNLGEIEPAEALFASSIARIDSRGSAVSRVKARVFLAQHRLNLGDRPATVAEADEAIALGETALAGGGAAAGLAPDEAAFTRDGNALVIDAAAADRLAATGPAVIGAEVATGQLTPRERLLVLMAQADYVAAAAALSGGAGDPSARLASAATRLDDVPPNVALWLRAEIARLSAETALVGGDLAAALDESSRAVRIARRYAAGERPEALLRLQQGRLNLAADRPGSARASYERALDILSRGGRGVRYDELAPYLTLLAEESADPGRDAALFLALQQLRDPATSETLARLAARLGAGSSEAAQAIRAEQDAERAVNREAAALDRLTAAETRDENAIRITRARLAQAQADLAAAEAAVAAAAPNYRQIADESVSLAAFQAQLRPGELFLQTRLGRSGGVVAAITASSFRLVPTDIALEEAQSLVDRARESIYSPFFDVAAARGLYTGMFGALGSEIAAASSVIVAPDGPLLSIPPALMIAEEPTGYTEGSLDYSSVQWFGTVKPISVTLSTASFFHLRQVAPSQAPKPFRGFGNFVPFGPAQAPEVATRRAAPGPCGPVLGQLGGLSPLPGTADEVRQLARIAGAGPDGVVLGQDFTETAIEETGLEDVRILHFATHGLLPLSADCLPEPALATSLGPTGDGLLEAGEIVDLKLDANLVVLSACDTGGRGATSALGTGFRGSGGEALSGLVRAFFYAGARNVVASHWLVPDTETVALMRTLYTGLARGESPAAAMQSARRALTSAPESSHPFFWAAFSAIGDAGRETRLAGAIESTKIARRATPTE